MANPETCLHRVVFAGFNRFELTHFIVCSSCGTDVTDRSNHINKVYRYDISTDVWVYIGKRDTKSPSRRMEQAVAELDLQGAMARGIEEGRRRGQREVDGDHGLPDVRSEQSRSGDEQADGSD